MPTTAANGLAIEYESFGRNDDPAILLIMGYACQLTLWPESLCVGLAAKGFRVVRFDNRDVGKSTHLSHLGTPSAADLMAALRAGGAPVAPYTLEDMAGDAVALMDALGVDRAHVAGASMGGMIAQILALNHPERARSLISIMSTTGRRDLPPADPDVMRELMVAPPSARREDRIVAAMRMWRAIGGPGFPADEPELRARAEREVDRVPFDPDGFARQMAAVICAAPRHEALPALRVPALVIHGEDDRIIPIAGGRDTADRIPGAELAAIPGMGHELTEALVPVLLERIGAFVGQVEARAG